MGGVSYYGNNRGRIQNRLIWMTGKWHITLLNPSFVYVYNVGFRLLMTSEISVKGANSCEDRRGYDVDENLVLINGY